LIAVVLERNFSRGGRRACRTSRAKPQQGCRSEVALDALFTTFTEEELLLDHAWRLK
jgi:hypothetical protein